MFVKQDQSLVDEIARIDEIYCDPKTYAKSYRAYLQAKSKVLNGQVSAIDTAVSFSDDEGNPYNPEEVVLALKRYLSGANTVDAINDEQYPIDHNLVPFVESDSVDIHGNVYNNVDFQLSDEEELAFSGDMIPLDLIKELAPHAGSAMAIADSNDAFQQCDFISVYKAYAYSASGIKPTYDTSCIKTLDATKPRCVDDFKRTFSHLLTDSNAMIACLSAVADGVVESVSDLISNAKDVIGQAANSEVVERCKELFAAVNGSTVDLVKGIGNMLSSAFNNMDNIDPNTGDFMCPVDNSAYTSVSMASAFSNASVTVFKNAANTIVTGVKVAAAIGKSLFNIGKKILGKVKNKLGTLVTNAYIVENKEYEDLTFDYPAFQFEINRSGFISMCENDQGYIHQASQYWLYDGDVTSLYAISPHEIILMMCGYDPTGAGTTNLQNDAQKASLAYDLLLDAISDPTYALMIHQKFSTVYFFKYKVGAQWKIRGIVYAVPCLDFNDHGIMRMIHYTASEDQNPGDGRNAALAQAQSNMDCTISQALRDIFPDDPSSLYLDPDTLYKNNVARQFPRYVQNGFKRCLIYSMIRARMYRVKMNDGDPVAQLADTNKPLWWLIYRSDLLSNLYIDYGVISEAVDTSQVSYSYRSHSYMYDSTDLDSTGIFSGTLSTILRWTWGTGWMASITSYLNCQGTIADNANLTNGLIAQQASLTDGKWLDLTTDNAAYQRLFGIVLGPIFGWLLSGVMGQIASNKYENMQRYYLNNGSLDFPVFIPYKEAASLQIGRFHLQTDAQMAAKAQTLKNLAATITTLILAVGAVVAIKYVASKTKLKLSFKNAMLAEKARYNYEDMCSAFDQGKPYELISAGTDLNKVSKWMRQLIIYHQSDYTSKYGVSQYTNITAKAFLKNKAGITLSHEQAFAIALTKTDMKYLNTFFNKYSRKKDKKANRLDPTSNSDEQTVEVNMDSVQKNLSNTDQKLDQILMAIRGF